MKNKTIFIYLLVIYSISWLIQLFAIFGTSGINSDEAEIFLLVTMLVPALVTIVLLVKDKSLRSKILWKPNIKIIKNVLIGVFVPTLIAFSVVSVFSVLGYGNPKWFNFTIQGVNVTGGPWLLGIGENGWLFFILNVALTAFVYSLMSGIPAVAEEFAWRGFLQGILIDRFGMTRGIILLGTIWSFWHLPALLAGYNHPGYPILGSFLLQPIQEIAVSFFLAWLTISARSFIPAAIAHGAGNSIQEGVISNIELQVPVIYKDITTLMITVIVGVVFWYILRKKMQNNT
jgi:membrane protease YdiL (CAAX protease family)